MKPLFVSRSGRGRLRRGLRHAAGEQGFTLIELLVVIVIIGILLAIAVPSYLGFRGRAQDSKAQANIRTAIPAAEAFFSDNGTYTGMTKSVLISSYNSALTGDTTLKLAVKSGGAQYCFDEVGQGTTTWYYAGPGGTITSANPIAGTCP